MTNKVGDSTEYLLLFQNLPKNILMNISTMSDSAAQIWAYLEEKYGKSKTVAREVIAELKTMDSSKLGEELYAQVQCHDQ